MTETTYSPEHLDKWERPQHYFGAHWHEYYSAGVGQSRDSDALERANFDAMLDLLGGESDTVIVVRENHWAVGWVEWIAVHESDAAALRIADDAKQRLEDYPVLDEERYSEYEDEDCAATWDCMDWRQRAAYLRDRVQHAPDDYVRNALAAVRGDWHAAANLLPCPSDLLC